MIRVAIVGLGMMGKVHLRSYAAVAGAEVVALCDLEVDLGELARDVGLGEVRTYTDLSKMLADGGFEAVDICLPTDLHAEAAVAALQAGFHVICEKPMALDIASCTRMIDAARDCDRILSIAQCLRFWPAYTEIKRLIDDGTYGAVRYASFERHAAPPVWGKRGWFGDPTRSGGALLDLHIHDVDMVLHLFGMPQSLVATGLVDGQDDVSYVSALYRYPDRVVTATGGWVASSAYGFTMRALVALEGAMVSFDHSREQKVIVYPQGAESEVLPLPAGDGYIFELQGFVDAIAEGVLAGVVTPESAARSVAICLEEKRSVVEGQEIVLSKEYKG